MDLARWKQIDLATASDIVTKVYAGNMGTLSRYGIIVKEGATATEALAEIQKAAAGQAETYGKTVAGQMDLLQNNLGDVKEAIGGALIPVIADLFKKIMPVIQNIKAWISEHPKLTKIIVIAAAALGGLMLILGPLLMVLPGLIAMLPILSGGFALLGGAIAFATGPILPIIAGIAALIAIGILLYKNWDTISAWAVKTWGGIRDFFSNIWESIVGIFKNHWDKILAILFPPIGIPILIAKNWATIKDALTAPFRAAA